MNLYLSHHRTSPISPRLAGKRKLRRRGREADGEGRRNAEISFAVAVGPWVAGERARTEEEGGDRMKGKENGGGSRVRERNGLKEMMIMCVYIYIYIYIYIFLI